MLFIYESTPGARENGPLAERSDRRCTAGRCVGTLLDLLVALRTTHAATAPWSVQRDGQRDLRWPGANPIPTLRITFPVIFNERVRGRQL